MNLDAYLRRIGLDSRPPPSLAGLRALHRAHLLAVPYENIDVQLGRPVTIERPASFDKIVTGGRGGWCFEMNGILGWALGELGFRVTRATGAVGRATMGDASLGNHLVLRVDLDEGVYLADVGFGDGPIEPFPVRAGVLEADGFAFAVERADGEWWRLHNHPNGGARSFDFHLAPADESLLAAKCDFLRTSPTSPFVQNVVAQRYTRTGLTILRGRTLRHLTPVASRERLIADEADFLDVLREEFALDLPEAASLWPRIVARHEVVMAERAAAPNP